MNYVKHPFSQVKKRKKLYKKRKWIHEFFQQPATCDDLLSGYYLKIWGCVAISQHYRKPTKKKGKFFFLIEWTIRVWEWCSISRKEGKKKTRHYHLRICLLWKDRVGNFAVILTIVINNVPVFFSIGNGPPKWEMTERERERDLWKL